MADVKQFTLPDVGEGLIEADILTWHVKEGDSVAVNDIIVEVETAKSAVELPSPFAGIVTAVHVSEGETVEVGSPLATISDVAAVDRPADTPATPGAREPEPAAEPEPQRQSVLVGYGPTRANVARRARKAADRTAQPNGYEGGNEVRFPIKGVRKHTADAMVASAFTAPHVTEWVTVDVTRTLKLMDRMRGDKKAFADVRLTPLVMVARAALLSLGRHPEANAKWDDAAGEIVRLRDVNLGIATATPRGLLVPNIRAAQSLSTLQLADALGVVVAEARAGRTPPERMRDGTFTITNIGVFAVDGGTPILNPGEAAILCVGQIRRQPWEHKGRIKLRSMTTLALSFDHRLVDGELGSKVLADIAGVLEHPDLALIW